MSDFLTQPEWADRCGVSLRTFFTWRASGLIPAPDVNLPGQLRWSVGLVERTMRGFRRPAVGRPAFGHKANTTRRRNRGFQSQASRFKQPVGPSKGVRLSPQDVGVVHRESVDAPESIEQCHSVVGAR